MKQVFCGQCFKLVDYEVVEVEKEIHFKDADVKVKIKEAKCKDCGFELDVDEITRENDLIIYDAYKEKVGLLTSKQIKNIRLKYNLTQKKFGEILGLGEKTITRLENGDVQSKAIDNLIKLCSEYSNFYKLKEGSFIDSSFITEDYEIPKLIIKMQTMNYQNNTNLKIGKWEEENEKQQVAVY